MADVEKDVIRKQSAPYFIMHLRLQLQQDRCHTAMKGTLTVHTGNTGKESTNAVDLS